MIKKTRKKTQASAKSWHRQKWNRWPKQRRTDNKAATKNWHKQQRSWCNKPPNQKRRSDPSRDGEVTQREKKKQKKEEDPGKWITDTKNTTINNKQVTQATTQKCPTKSSKITKHLITHLITHRISRLNLMRRSRRKIYVGYQTKNNINRYIPCISWTPKIPGILWNAVNSMESEIHEVNNHKSIKSMETILIDLNWRQLA